eukprot:1517824-Rhodomonas_salina.1
MELVYAATRLLRSVRVWYPQGSLQKPPFAEDTPAQTMVFCTECSTEAAMSGNDLAYSPTLLY